MQAMAKTFKLEVITASQLFYSGEAEMVIVKTLLGEEGFMADHSWACKLLDTGAMRIQEPGQSGFKWAAVSGGYIDVKDSIVIYTDFAKWAEDIDVSEAQKAKAKAEAYIAENQDKATEPAEVEALSEVKFELKKALACIRAAENGK